MSSLEEALLDVIEELHDASTSQEWLDALDANRRAHIALMDARTSAVANARADRATWRQIGKALGVTKQAAQERYGRPTDPVAKEERQPTPPKTYLHLGLDGRPLGIILPAKRGEIDHAIREHLHAIHDDVPAVRQEPLTSSSNPDAT